MANPLIPDVKYATLITEGNGTQTEWEFNFAGGYISRDHVKAFTEDKVTGQIVIRTFDFVGPNTVRISPAVANGLRLVIYRDTPKMEPIVNYTDGSVMSETNLDKSNQQAVFIAAELADRVVADYDFSNSLIYAVETATSAAATANAIDGKAQQALDTVNNLLLPTGSGLVGYNNPQAVQYTLKEQLDLLYYGMASVRDKRFAGGAKGDNVNDDAPAFRACIRWAEDNKATVWIPGGNYRFATPVVKTGSFLVPNMQGAGCNASVIYYDGPGAGLVIVGGSGSASTSWLRDVGFMGTTTNYNIEVQDQNYFKMIHCRFFKGAIGVLYHNRSGFTEWCSADQCSFESPVDQAVVYKKTVATGGHDSFHGSGLRDCIIVERAGQTLPKIEIGGPLSDDSLILVYNAELSFQIWKNTPGIPIIKNNSMYPNTNFRGVCTVEDFSRGGFNFSEGSPVNLVGVPFVELTKTMTLGSARLWATYSTDQSGVSYGWQQPKALPTISGLPAEGEVQLCQLYSVDGEVYQVQLQYTIAGREWLVGQTMKVQPHPYAQLISVPETLWAYFGGQAAIPTQARFRTDGAGRLYLKCPAGWDSTVKIRVTYSQVQVTANTF